MAASSRLGRQIEEVVAVLDRIGARYALIGGLALAAHKVVRATQDVDLLTEAASATEIDSELAKLGYRCLHRSEDAGNYLRGDERLDLLFASRPIAQAADGGLALPPPIERDPYEILDDLMMVIEELCPIWPQRPVFTTAGQWRL